MKRRIAFLIYHDFQLLDAAGPIAAFEIAGRYRPHAYQLQVVAIKPGHVTSSSGMAMHAEKLCRASCVDTLVIAGGDGSRVAARDRATLAFIHRCAIHARRVTSVCTGSFLLAAAGLLDNKSATTHWSCVNEFRQRFPKVRLNAEHIFVKAGKCWTSAGITAGIDMALALIKEDLGEDIARATAQQLVLYYQRPGGQSQFSPLLEMTGGEQRFAKLLEHMRTRLSKPLSVNEMAALCAMSPRHFSRLFQAEVGVSPAKALERLRVDAARSALGGQRSLQDIANICGFGSTERMRKSFLRILGTLPSTLKRAK